MSRNNVSEKMDYLPSSGSSLMANSTAIEVGRYAAI